MDGKIKRHMGWTMQNKNFVFLWVNYFVVVVIIHITILVWPFLFRLTSGIYEVLRLKGAKFGWGTSRGLNRISLVIRPDDHMEKSAAGFDRREKVRRSPPLRFRFIFTNIFYDIIENNIGCKNIKNNPERSKICKYQGWDHIIPTRFSKFLQPISSFIIIVH